MCVSPSAQMSRAADAQQSLPATILSNQSVAASMLGAPGLGPGPGLGPPGIRPPGIGQIPDVEGAWPASNAVRQPALAAEALEVGEAGAAEIGLGALALTALAILVSGAALRDGAAIDGFQAPGGPHPDHVTEPRQDTPLSYVEPFTPAEPIGKPLNYTPLGAPTTPGAPTAVQLAPGDKPKRKRKKPAKQATPPKAPAETPSEDVEEAPTGTDDVVTAVWVDRRQIPFSIRYRGPDSYGIEVRHRERHRVLIGEYGLDVIDGKPVLTFGDARVLPLGPSPTGDTPDAPQPTPSDLYLLGRAAEKVAARIAPTTMVRSPHSPGVEQEHHGPSAVPVGRLGASGQDPASTVQARLEQDLPGERIEEEHLTEYILDAVPSARDAEPESRQRLVDNIVRVLLGRGALVADHSDPTERAWFIRDPDVHPGGLPSTDGARSGHDPRIEAAIDKAAELGVRLYSADEIRTIFTMDVDELIRTGDVVEVAGRFAFRLIVDYFHEALLLASSGRAVTFQELMRELSDDPLGAPPFSDLQALLSHLVGQGLVRRIGDTYDVLDVEAPHDGDAAGHDPDWHDRFTQRALERGVRTWSVEEFDEFGLTEDQIFLLISRGELVRVTVGASRRLAVTAVADRLEEFVLANLRGPVVRPLDVAFALRNGWRDLPPFDDIAARAEDISSLLRVATMNGRITWDAENGVFRIPPGQGPGGKGNH